jgi:hypothetical protein
MWLPGLFLHPHPCNPSLGREPKVRVATLSIVGKEIELMEVTFDLLINLDGDNTNYKILNFGNGIQVLLFLANLLYLPHLLARKINGNFLLVDYI